MGFSSEHTKKTLWSHSDESNLYFDVVSVPEDSNSFYLILA